MTKILLTGGSGFIAAHTLDILLEKGHEVITTVRTEEKAAKLREAHPGAKLTVLLTPDIAVPGAFDEALKTPGLEVVLHTASPFHFKWQDPKTELLDPAINGTKSVLSAIKTHAPGVKRLVVTSSFASILSENLLGDPSKTFTEADWNSSSYEDGLKDNKATSYRVSKKYAELAAWEFVEKEKPGFDLVTICPPLVLGPVVHHLNTLDNINTSNQKFVDILQGKWKEGVPPTGAVYLWVDVRDVALAHVRAMEVPEAGGKRYFAVTGAYSNKQMAEAAIKNFPELKDKLPSDEKLLAPGDFPASGYAGYDNSRATKELGINWIPFEKSAVDAIASLKSIGA